MSETSVASAPAIEPKLAKVLVHLEDLGTIDNKLAVVPEPSPEPSLEPSLEPSPDPAPETHERAYDYLRGLGIAIERRPNGAYVVDVDALLTRFTTKGGIHAQPMGEAAYQADPIDQEHKQKTKVQLLIDLFDGLNIYDKKDIEDYLLTHDGSDEGMDDELEPKPLFYIPDSAEAALSIDAIQHARFHKGIWEIDSSKKPALQPLHTEGDEEHVGFDEATIACLIYHPQYGNGERDEQGRLVVTFADGARRPITADFFQGYHFSGSRQAQLRRSPASFFQKDGQSLVREGLIDLQTDFKIQAGSAAEQLYGSNMREPSPKGLVMIDRVRYTLGTEYSAQNGYRVYRLNKEYAAIINIAGASSSGVVEKVFRLHHVPHEGGTPSGDYIYKGKSEIEFIDPRDSEYPNTDLSANFDIQALTYNFELYMCAQREMQQRCEVSLSSLTTREQSLAAALYIRYKDEPEFWHFLKQKSLQGLRSIMALQGNDEAINLLLDPSADVFRFQEKFMAEVSLIFNTIVQFEVAHARGSKDKDAIVRSMIAYAGQLAAGTLRIAHGEVDGLDEIHAIDLLRRFSLTLTRSMDPHSEPEHDPYHAILAQMSSQSSRDVQTATLAWLRTQWDDQIAREAKMGDGPAEAIRAQVIAFYKDNEELFKTASETTGDTEAELAQFQEYAERNGLNGVIADLGCGPGRLAIPKAQMLQGKAEIIGIDLVPPVESPEPNLRYLQGDLSVIPLPDNSVDFAEANWSVLNDSLLREQHLVVLQEVARILKENGVFRFDVPHLEGGEGSWEEVARKHHEQFPQTPFGTITADFSSGSKEFYIYPTAELEALLRSQGFTVERKLEWRTTSGKPRLTIEARLTDKVTPALLQK